MAIYITLKDSLVRRKYLLEEILNIGRDDKNEIAIPNEKISARHGQFYRVGYLICYKDLNSRNGSYLNGKPIKFCKLFIGDKIEIAGLTFSIDDSELNDSERMKLSRS